jgi:NADH-quinone oxidoreductase subunit I
MIKALKEIVGGLWSLLVGMRVTIGQFFKPTITVHYPHEALKMTARFRGHIELVKDPETGKPICYACKMCEKACPSDCIAVEGEKLEGAKRKSVNYYRLDFTKCSLCGACVEACRDHAIRFTHDYNLASVNKEDFIMDLFKKLEDEARQAEKQEDAPAPTEATQAVQPEATPAKIEQPEPGEPGAEATKKEEK